MKDGGLRPKITTLVFDSFRAPHFISYSLSVLVVKLDGLVVKNSKKICCLSVSSRHHVDDVLVR